MQERSLATGFLTEGKAEIGRSFRLHRPRGAFCHAGWCQQCLVTLEDGRRVLACQTDGGQLRPKPAPGLGRLIGRMAESLPPWFHERRLLRPVFLRQTYLRLLRRLSAAPRLGPTLARQSGCWQRRDCDSLVVGGGLSGLRAASDLARSGHRVVLTEAQSLGGRSRFRADRGEDLAAAIAALGSTTAVTLPDTTCLGLYDGGQEALCSGPGGPVMVRFRHLVVATGAYDRLLPFAGNDLPGIIGLRAFERLCVQGGVPVQVRVGVFGHADAVVAAGVAARAAGRGNAIDAFGGLAVVAAHGRRRIDQVTLSDGRRARCDLLVLGFDQPTYELQMQAGMAAALTGDPPVVVPAGGAAIPVSVVGAAAGAPATPGAALPMAADAFICPCEDVRVRDVRQAVADGFTDIDLLKRRTGAGTGPCQGKLCHANLLWCAREMGIAVTLPTVRPLLRPTALGALAAAADG